MHTHALMHACTHTHNEPSILALGWHFHTSFYLILTVAYILYITEFPVYTYNCERIICVHLIHSSALPTHHWLEASFLPLFPAQRLHLPELGDLPRRAPMDLGSRE